MKIKIGVMGPSAEPDSPRMADLARSLGEAIAARDLILLTGATTGAVHLIGKTARDAGALHIGISPAANEREHVERFKLPIELPITPSVFYRKSAIGNRKLPSILYAVR